MTKEEIDILYSFANDEDCGYVYDWQGFDYEEICPLVDKLIKENQKYKEVIDKAREWINNHIDTFEERNITIYDWNSLSNPKDLLDILKGVE